LNVTAECDTANIDATRGGQVSVLIRIHGTLTHPPPPSDPPGFDAVILLDVALPEPKLALAKRAVKNLVQATTQTSRLGLVTFGRDARVVAQLTMCTPPYKRELAVSVEDLAGERRRGGVFREGMKCVLGMLGKDARFGGHVFVVSDGGFDPGSRFWEGCSTTVHVIAVGGLVWGERLRGLRQQAGGFIEVREGREEGWSKCLDELVGYLGGQTYLDSIETVRCRITCPDTHVSLLDVNDSPIIDSPDQFSLTLRTSPNSPRGPHKPLNYPLPPYCVWG
jgi:hypothetical protein